DAAQALAMLDGAAYRPFNLIIADNRDAFWLRHAGGAHPKLAPVPEGISMLTSRDLNDRSHARIATYLPRFRAAPLPAPADDATGGDWHAWEALMAATEEGSGGPRGAVAIAPQENGYATLSGSLIALPAPGVAERPVWRFCPARPGT